jgi:hypothetical protein
MTKSFMTLVAQPWIRLKRLHQFLSFFLALVEFFHLFYRIIVLASQLDVLQATIELMQFYVDRRAISVSDWNRLFSGFSDAQASIVKHQRVKVFSLARVIIANIPVLLGS